MQAATDSGILRKLGNGRQVYVRVATPTHVPRGRITLQMHGFPMPTYGKHSRWHNFYSIV